MMFAYLAHVNFLSMRRSYYIAMETLVTTHLKIKVF